ncbi:hypothetical protein A3B84_01135 [Candidatus Nomurabacteria bacterium RIFCSPHIGHO2_02_FULL_35_13]|uniref:Uncharacterized protein n=2 Tax=Candidatus Nomuraibacteriota TaxID=1752729 RepID=A0A1F6VQN2_9BACT|nr:MAG: hypothetical protein UR88_C0005G0019 [Candidatus Nomurabacteria bacterium GW2011_GWA1_35_8]OGI71745.1 MAG: hypothetical protein A3B84_01135 [Candidatus Nomurabacteria bacterium RIFCSPHIGHO2_02_FULL_35_13]
MIKNIGKNNKGYAILETIFYIALFAILSISVIDAMIIMTKAFKEVTIQTELMRNGNIMERISREIRQAHNINSINTTSLKLDTTDDVGADRTVEFSLSGSDIRFSENDVFTGNLNTPNTTVVDIAFMQINTAKGMAVKVILTVKSNRDSLNRNESFYNTIVLRGSY